MEHQENAVQPQEEATLRRRVARPLGALAMVLGLGVCIGIFMLDTILPDLNTPLPSERLIKAAIPLNRDSVIAEILTTTVIDLEARQRRIETAISQSPDKALALPLLRNDLEALRRQQQADIVAVRSEVDRIYDLNKYLMGGVAVSIIMLGFNTFAGAKRDRAKPE